MVQAIPETAEPVQAWSPAEYAHSAAFVPILGMPVVELLDPRAGETILDVGCGDGALTEEIARRGAAVVGVDASGEFVAAARARGLDARHMSGEQLAFDGVFDAVFSNAALHWMTDPAAVVQGVFRALKPGGRFVAEMGGAGNVHAIGEAMLAVLADRGIDGSRHWPWYFPTEHEYAALLSAAGFTVVSIMLMPRPTRLPGSLKDWLRLFAQVPLAPLDLAAREVVMDEIETRVASKLLGNDGVWTADYVRLRFFARRP